MNSQIRSKQGFGKVGEVFRETFSALKENPTILILFMILATIDVTALTLAFLAPFKPFSPVFAPIIRTFWGERFLHYPENFVLLPKLFRHAHFLILASFGILISGVVIKKILAWTQGRFEHTSAAFAPVLKRYFSLLLAWGASYAIFVVLMRSILARLPTIAEVQFAIALTLAVLLQSLFAYLIPALLISEGGLLNRLKKGITFGVKNFFITALIVFVPVLLMTIMGFLKALAPVLVDVYPESILWIMLFSIAVSAICDLLITVSTAIFYIQEGEVS